MNNNQLLLSTQIMFKNLKKISIPLLLIIITGCTTLTSEKEWPSDIPEKKIFVDKFLSNRNVETASKKRIRSHLSWIYRFYQGTLLYPNGWTSVSMQFLDSIEEQDGKEAMAMRLRELGIAISNEWAQDNDVRLINSANVAAWGSALRTSAERDDQENYLSKVEQDVEALLDGTLKANQISYERYYPAEDYDDF